jgi:predicted nucleotidyltransferase
MDRGLRKTIMRYRQNLEAMGTRVKRIILFGSWATGRGRADSDVDLLVISDDFKGMDMWERMSMLGCARADISRPMEILGMTEAEFRRRRRDSFIAQEVVAKGVEV